MTQMDSTTATLGGKQFEVCKLDPLVSLRTFNVVKAAVGPALGLTLGTIESLGELSDLLDSPEGGGKLGAVIERLLTDATFDRQKILIDVFMPVTKVDGRELTADAFSLVFRGDLPLLFSWLKLCLRGEWGNVLGAISDAIGSAVAQVQLGKKSPDTSERSGQSTI